jgi:hypothetical protein
VSLPDGMLVLCGLAVVAGTIHVVAAVQHAGVSWTLGVFFAVVGVAQLLAGWWIYREPDDHRILVAVAWGSIGVALLWVWSRTTGMPFGPESGKVSKIGTADSIATLQELAFAAIAAVIVRRPGRAKQRLAWLSTGMGARVTSAMLSASLFVAAVGGHQH